MHTPDGFLTSWICVVMLLISLLPLLLALNNLRKSFSLKKAGAIVAVTAAILVMQAFDFPVPNGTTGHLLGITFALLALGIDGAVLSMTVALAIQAFVFADGGITTLGANVFNMAVLGVYIAHFVSRSLSGTTVYVRTFVASWLSVFIAAISCALQLAISGTVPLVPALMEMGGTHAVVGGIEGLATALFAVVLCNRTGIMRTLEKTASRPSYSPVKCEKMDS